MFVQALAPRKARATSCLRSSARVGIRFRVADPLTRALVTMLLLAGWKVASGTPIDVYNDSDLASANLSAAPGTVVILHNHTYTDFRIEPLTSGTAANRIAYIGNLQHPESVVIQSGITPKSYLTIKGITAGSASADVIYPPVVGDSLSNCIVAGSLSVLGTHQSVFHSLVVNGSRFIFGRGIDDASQAAGMSTSGNVVENCRFTNLVADAGNGGWAWVTGNADRDRINHRERVSDCTFRFNRLHIDFSGAAPSAPAKHFHVSNCLFYGNRMDISGSVTSMGDETNWIAWRDSSFGNRFVRDTIIAENLDTHVGLEPFLSSAGTFGGSANYDNTLDSCYWKVRIGGPALLDFNDDLPGLTMRNCQLIVGVGLPVHLVNGLGSGVVMRHNTFYTAQEQDWSDESTPWTAPELMAGNIFYAGTVSACEPTSDGRTVLMRETHTDTPGDSSLYYRANGSATSALWYNSTAKCQAIAEPHSVWANPAFADTNWSTLDLRPTTAPPGGCAEWPNGYVGALQYAPAAITDVDVADVGRTSAVVSWTSACHADDVPGTWVLRYATVPITAANFNSAATVAEVGEVAAVGTEQCGTASGLASNTQYYFAVRTTAGAESSGVSNCAYVTTASSGADVFCAPVLQRHSRAIATGPARKVLRSPLSIRAGLPSRFMLEADRADRGQRYEVELFDLAGRREAHVAGGVVAEGETLLELSRAPGGYVLRPGVHFVRTRIGERRAVRMLVLTP